MRRKCTDDLLFWKKNLTRKPLVLQGIRQSGKTWLLRDFGSRQYEDCIYINLETDRPAADYLSVPRDAEEALLFLETYANKPLRQGSTLLILDNFQCIPNGAELLRSVGMDFPGYHVACIEKGTAGKYDSGDVDVLQLFPLDFEEFLWANKEFGLAREIREHFPDKTPLGKKLHEKALSQFLLYLAIGGMPAAICEYRAEKKLLMVPDTQKRILDLFQADITALAPEGCARHCRNCWQSIPSQLCKENGKFQYRQVVKGGTAKVYQEPLNWLSDTGFVYRSPKRNALTAGFDMASFRLYLPDTGLFSCSLGLPLYALLCGEESPLMRAAAENFLARTFVQNGYRISYWNSGNQAEIPFLLEKNGVFAGVDFRINSHQKQRNLAQISKEMKDGNMYLISTEDFKKKDFYSIIPFYAAFCI